MFLRPLEGLKCTEEPYKEYYLKDLQDNIDLLSKVAKTAKIEIFNNSAGKKGKAPNITTFSTGTKFVNQINPKIYEFIRRTFLFSFCMGR